MSFSTCACAISIRSKGSRWRHGSRETCRVCEATSGRLSKDSAASLSMKSSGSRNLPRLCLSQISQRETALTMTVFSGSLIVSLAWAVSAGLSSSHQSKTWVSRRILNSVVPSSRGLPPCRPAGCRNRERLKSRRPSRRTSGGPGRAVERHQPGHRFPGLGDDDFAAALYRFDEGGKLGLRRGDIAQYHSSIATQTRPDPVWSDLAGCASSAGAARDMLFPNGGI